MWIGGEEPPDSMDVKDLSGEATAVSASVPQVQQELHDLQEQFAAQQQLLGSLKSKLPQASHQDYATRLAAMRSRLGRPAKHAKPAAAAGPAPSSTENPSLRTESIRMDPTAQPFEVVLKESEGLVGSSKLGGSLADVSTMAVSEKAQELSSHSQVAGGLASGEAVPKKARTSSFSEGTSHSKIHLLRKQLDENRTKYERQQRDNKEKKASMEEMKKKMDKLRQELEQRNEFIQNLEKGIIPLQSQPTTQQLCQQLLQKDAIVYSLTSRVNELESLCQDQADRLGEKDCLIESRTEAVALVTKDRDDKILKMMEEMEERESSMREMQERFTKQEEEWKAERDSLTRSLAEKSNKVVQLEESHRRTESIRFELAARNAELQEKIVTLQSDLSEVTANLESEKNKCQQSHNSIQELKQKLSKAEAHGRSKLKGLEKQIKSMKSGQQSGQNILDLHNQIAVLEEEKGNLQLRLVDFDDLKAANVTLEETTAVLKKKLADFNSDLDAKSTFISSLEKEKIKLVELLNDREEKLVDFETSSSQLKLENERLERIEVELKKQVHDLEDKNVTLGEELSELQSEMKAVAEAKENAPEKDLRDELERRVLELTKEVDTLKETCDMQKEDMKKLKERAEASVLSEQETSEANQRLLNILTDKENALASNAIEMDSWSATKNKLDDEIRELNDRCSRLQLEAESDRVTHEDEAKKLQKLLSDKEAELEDFMVQSKQEANRLMAAVREAETLQSKLSEMEDVVDQLESELAGFKKRNSRLEKALVENEKMISSLKTDLKAAQDALDDNKERMRDYEQLIKELKSDAKTAEKNAEKLSELQKETEKNLLLKSKEIEKLQKDLNNSQKTLEDAQSNLCDRTDEVTSLSLERESLLEQLREQQSLAESKQLQIASLAAEIAAKGSGVSEDGSVVQMSATDADVIKKCYEEMEAKLELKDKLLSELQSVYEAVRQELLKCQSELVEKEASIKDLNDQITLREESERQQMEGIGDLQSHLESEQNARQTLHNNLVEEQRLKEELQSLMQAEQSAKTDLQDNLVREQQLREELQNKFASDQAAWQQQVDSLTAQLTQQSQSASSLSAQLAEMQQQLSEREPQLADMHQRQFERDQQLQAVQEQLAFVQQQLAAKESQLPELEKKLCEREQQLSEAQQKLDAAHAELESAAAQHAEATALQQQAAASAAAQDQQLQWSNEQMYQMQLDSHAKQAEINELRTRVESLSAQNEASNTSQHREELQRKVEQLEQEVAMLRGEGERLAQHEQNSSSLESQVKTLQAELDGLRHNLDSISSELQVRSASLQECSQKNVLLEATLDEMRLSASESERALQKYVEELREKTELNTSLEAQIACLGNPVLTDERMRAVEVELTETQQRLREMEEQLQQATTKNDELRRELNEKPNSVGDEGHLADRCRHLEAQLEEARLTITQLETSMATVTSGVQTQSEYSSPAADELGEVDLGGDSGGHVGRTSPELRGLQQALTEKTVLVEQMQEQLSELKNSARSQLEEMALLNQRLGSLEDTNNKLESRRQELQQQLLQEAEQNASLSEKILSLEETLSNVRKELETSEASKIEIKNSYEVQLAEKDSALSTVSGEFEAEKIRRLELETLNAQVQNLATNSSSTVDATDNTAAAWFSSHTESSEAESGTNATVSSQVVPESEAAQGTDGGVGAQQPMADVAELQYKLSWYEEQWTPFTTLYNELLQQHEEAKAKIIELTALLGKTEFPELQTSAENAGTAAAAVSSNDVAETSEIAADAAATTQASALSLEQQQILEQQYAALYSQYEESCRRIELLEAQLSEQTENTLVSSSTAEAQEATGQRSAASLFAKASTDSRATSTAESFFSSPSTGEQITELQSNCDRLEAELRAAMGEKERLLQENDDMKQRSATVTEQLRAAESNLQQVQTELQLLQQGGNGRVTELEQIVCSAEAEIAKLRNQLGSVQDERSRLHQVLAEMEEAVSQKSSSAEVKVARMEEELELQRRENITLKSELEVMEGENSRRSTDLEILESENMRLRADLETANQATQILEAEKESLVVETQRLEREKESLREEINQSNAACAHSTEQVRSLHEQLMATQQHFLQQQQQQHQQQQIAMQQKQMTMLQTVDTSQEQEAVQQPVNPGADVAGLHDDDELDWGSEGRKEVEHIQRSSSQDAFLREEVKSLKEKLISAEKERNGIAEDLQAAKIKSGKLLQKVKGLQSANEALQKDVNRLKSKGGLSGLDQALEEEFKAQVSQAQSERDELKQRLEEIVKEKDLIAKQSEVLKDANDRLIEMKEDQETQIRVLKSRNQDLESAVNSMEWKISELEEAVEEERRRPAEEKQLSNDGLVSDEASKQLRDQVIALEAQLDELSSSNMKVESINKDLSERLAELETENERLLSLKEALEAEVKQLKETNTKAEKDVGVYKEAFIEQQGQFEKLTEEKNTLSNDLDATEYQLKTLKSAYNALYMEHEEIKTDNASMKHSFLTLEGERDRLMDDVSGLTAELDAYRQETVEATVRGLEEEIVSLREACNTLKEEATEHGAQQVAMQDEIDRLSRDLQFSHGLQDDLQTRLLQKEQSERLSNTAVEQLERRGRYSEAEAAASAKQIQTLTEELERSRREVRHLQDQVRHWQQQSQHLSRQVESADASLSRLSDAGGGSDSPDDVVNAELEAALASLHLRDLRCHQLIIEINKLVEERDSLQLRLSSALRSNQELVKRCQAASPAAEGEAQADPPSSDEILPPLKTKLEQLRELNDEVEQKTMASVPPHPTIITPDYTLTRETQATSSTLINWIMGRTTPRVMHV